MHHNGLTFSFGKLCSPAIFEICFSCDKAMWIAANDYWMYFHIIAPFLLTAIHQLLCYVLGDVIQTIHSCIYFY